MRKSRITVVLCILATVLVLAVAAVPASAEVTASLRYSDFTSTTCDATGFSTGATGHANFSRDVIIHGQTYLNNEPYDTFSFGFPAGTFDFGTGFGRTFTTPQPSANWVFLFDESITTTAGTEVTLAQITLTCTNGVLTAVSFTGKVLVGGCDVQMAMPATSVVGSFVADAQLYAEPGVPVTPALTMPAGKTAWVLGLDSTGAYYEILWVCNYLWVPSSTMGPNYDNVWLGRPLPTGVVN